MTPGYLVQVCTCVLPVYHSIHSLPLSPCFALPHSISPLPSFPPSSSLLNSFPPHSTTPSLRLSSLPSCYSPSLPLPLFFSPQLLPSLTHSVLSSLMLLPFPPSIPLLLSSTPSLPHSVRPLFPNVTPLPSRCGSHNFGNWSTYRATHYSNGPRLRETHLAPTQGLRFQ